MNNASSFKSFSFFPSTKSREDREQAIEKILEGTHRFLEFAREEMHRQDREKNMEVRR